MTAPATRQPNDNRRRRHAAPRHWTPVTSTFLALRRLLVLGAARLECSRGK